MLHWSMAAALTRTPQSLTSCAMFSVTGIKEQVSGPPCVRADTERTLNIDPKYCGEI